MRSVAPRIAINERIKQEEKDRIRIVKEERRKAKRNLKKMGVTHSEWVETLSDKIQNEVGNYSGMIWTRDVKEAIRFLKKRNTITHQITIEDVNEIFGDKLTSDAVYTTDESSNKKGARKPEEIWMEQEQERLEGKHE